MPLDKGSSFALVLDMSPTVWTSLEEFHFRLCCSFKSRGVQPILIFAKMPSAECRQRMAASGAVIAVLDYSKGRLAYFRGLHRLNREHRICMAQSRGFNYFALLWWILWLAGIRNMIFLEGNSGLLHAVGWKRSLLRLRTRVLTWPIRFTATVTEFVRRQLIDIGMSPDRIRAIYNGVDRARFRPDSEMRERWRTEHGIRADEIVVSMICYLREFKKPHIMLEACSLLAKEGLPIRPVIAGTGELLEPMKQLSVKLGIAGRTIWLGNYPQTQSLLQASDVFVLSSVGEAIGNVLLEAMACGVPCVGSDSGGIPEIIVDGETGYLAKPLDPASFATAIRAIVEDRGIWRRMSERSIAVAHDRFDVDQTVRQFMELYDTL